ncbi:MAG: hypothetical protein R2777_04965 [Chitinophagales bacterium]
MPTACSRFNIMQKVRYKPTEYVDIQYGFHYSATSSYGRYDEHNRMHVMVCHAMPARVKIMASKMDDEYAIC